jgi:hypothetical protein
VWCLWAGGKVEEEVDEGYCRRLDGGELEDV